MYLEFGPLWEALELKRKYYEITTRVEKEGDSICFIINKIFNHPTNYEWLSHNVQFMSF